MIDRRTLLALGAAAWARPALAARKATAAPDLTGCWTNAWYTKLERPRTFKNLVVTAAEAEAFEAPRRALRGELDDKEHDKLGQATSEFPDNGPGLARINGQIRSSWIVEPADGRVPWSKEGLKRTGVKEQDPEVYDDVEQRPTDERCLTTPGGGAPIINSHDGNVVEIVQTRDWLIIVGEKNHDVRTVRIGGVADRAPPDGLWAGVSNGRWEGQTLVAETSGFRPGITKIGDELYISDRTRVVERFSRSGPGELLYAFDMDDPGLFTQPWRAEMVFRPTEGRIYEYACHEGNYSLPSILSAARQKETAAK